MVKNGQIKTILTPVLLFLFTFAVYIHNLSASVYGGDSGDFLSAIAVKGVPHPSGYPLYTILGILFRMIPIHQTFAWKIDLISALTSSLAIVVLYGIVVELTKNRLLAVVTSLSLAFLFPFWLFAEVAEVIALHHLLLLSMFYAAVLFYSRREIKYLYLFVVMSGLAFSNNETVILLIPSIALLLFRAKAKSGFSRSVLLKCIGLFLLGLLPYVYIPIAAAHNPTINWNHASTLTNFFHLVFRNDYGWGTLNKHNSNAVRLLSLQRYVSYWVSHLPIFLSITIIIGAFALVKQKKYTLFCAIVLATLSLGALFFLYDVTPVVGSFSLGGLEKFYPMSIIFLLLFFPFGIQVIADIAIRFALSISRRVEKKKLYTTTFHAFFLYVPFFLILTNFPKTDLHTVWIGDAFAKSILSPLPGKSYVLTSVDNIVFNTRFVQYAQDFRKDVQVYMPGDLTVEGSRDNSHYTSLKQFIDRNKNNLFYLQTNHADEFDQLSIAPSMPYGLIYKYPTNSDKNIDEATFVTTQKERLVNINSNLPSLDSLSGFLLIADLPMYYANAYANTGTYLMERYHDPQTALDFFKKALAIAPRSAIAYEGLGDYYYQTHDCLKARDSYTQATEIDIIHISAYQKLYNVVASCLHDATTTEKLRQLFHRYPNIFGDMTLTH